MKNRVLPVELAAEVLGARRFAEHHCAGRRAFGEAPGDLVALAFIFGVAKLGAIGDEVAAATQGAGQQHAMGRWILDDEGALSLVMAARRRRCGR